jgi:hypothetical protein
MKESHVSAESKESETSVWMKQSAKGTSTMNSMNYCFCD